MERDVEQLMAIARGWIAGARWRTASHRYGVKGRGFIRVAANPPVEALAEVLSILVGAEGCVGMFCDGKPVPGVWRARRAWYEEARSEDGTQAIGLRVFQMVGDSESEVDGPWVLENGCWAIEEHTFHFDEAAQGEVPAGESGVSYRMEGVRRDAETGLWSWVLIKRTRKAVNVSTWDFSRTVFEDTARAQMFGVRNMVKVEVEDEEGVKREVEQTLDEQVKAFADENGLKLVAGEGKTVRVEKRKNEDCTTDVTLENGKELSVTDSETAKEVSYLSTETRKVDRNQATAGTEPASAAQGTVKRVTSRKTPGGYYDVETVERTSTEVASGNADSVCQQTIFEHTHRDTARNQKSVTREATTAGSGKTYEQRVRMNEDGTFDVEEETRNELSVTDAETAKEVSYLSTETRKVDRNQATAGTEPASAAQGTVKRVTSRKTPGGYYDVETVERTSTEVASGNADSVCQQTIFEHTHRDTARNQKSVTREATTAGSGKTYEQRVRMNEDGTFDVEEETRNELSVESAEKHLRRGALTEELVVVDRNQTGTQTTLSLQETKQATLTEETQQKTPGGAVDVRKVTRQAFKKEITISPAADPQGTTHAVLRFYNYKSTEVAALEATWQQITCSMNEFGLFDGQASKVTHAEGGRRARTTRDIRTYEKTDSASTGRIVAVGSKIFRMTITESTIEGVLNDNADAAFAKVAGCSNRKVQHLGGGYYSYFGVMSRTEVWEPLGDVEDGTATDISGSWGKGA